MVDCNASAMRLTGKAGSALQQCNIEDVIGRDAWSGLVGMVDGTQTDPGIPRIVTAEIRNRNSRSIVELSLGYHGFDDGLFGVVVMSDVTERERVVQELRTAHRRMRDVIEFLPDPTFVLGANGEVLEWNRAMERLTGIPKRMIVGRSGYECSVPIYGRRCSLLAHRVLGLVGEDPPPAYEVIERSTDRFEAGVFAPSLRKGRGAHLWASASALRDDDGRVVGAIESLRDQTEQLAAAEAMRTKERDLRVTLDSIRDAVVTTDAQGIVRRMNPAAEALTMWSSNDALGRPLAEVVELLQIESRVPIDRPEFHVLRASGEQSNEDLLLRSRDEKERRVSARGGPILDEAGEVEGLVVVIRDVTEQRETERQLAFAQKMESIGRLAYGVAHDFNNVLGAIRGYADVLAEELDLDSPLREDVEEILRATTRAKDLTRSLLAFSRPDVSEPKTVDVHMLVTGLQKMVARIIGEDINLHLALGAREPCVLADPSQIEQVILNLVVNSRDAMPSGGDLTISTKDLDSSDDDKTTLDHHLRSLEVSVADSGVGMDEETRKRVFEPFFTTKGPEQGSGIGLSTTFSVVQQLGGRIRVESRVGEGTTFIITLPTSDCVSTVRKHESITPGTVDTQATILIAEDEPVLRRLVSRILAKRGYHVLSAGDGVEALAIAAAWTGTIDLLVSDVVMPKMGGVELQKRLQDARPDIKTLFVSGYSTDAMVQRGLRGDKPGFLAKPFTTGRLIAKVRELLDNGEALSQ